MLRNQCNTWPRYGKGLKMRFKVWRPEGFKKELMFPLHQLTLYTPWESTQAHGKSPFKTPITLATCCLQVKSDCATGFEVWKREPGWWLWNVHRLPSTWFCCPARPIFVAKLIAERAWLQSHSLPESQTWDFLRHAGFVSPNYSVYDYVVYIRLFQ